MLGVVWDVMRESREQWLQTNQRAHSSLDAHRLILADEIARPRDHAIEVHLAALAHARHEERLGALREAGERALAVGDRPAGDRAHDSDLGLGTAAYCLC